MALLHIVLSALLMLIQFFGGHVATYFFRIFGLKDYIPCDSFKVITGVDIWFPINLMNFLLLLHCQSTHPALGNTI